GGDAMSFGTRIDFASVTATADFQAVLTDRLGAPKILGGKPHWPCPFHTDGNPSLYLYDHGRRYRCWPCGLTGDVLDFLARYENVKVIDAAKMLDPSLGAPPKKPRKAPAKLKPALPKDAPAWHAADWQAAVGELIA